MQALRAGTVARLDRQTPPDRSIFAHCRHFVASIDTVKGDAYRKAFLQFCPDLVLVDGNPTLRITDLRMGQEPDYVFNFDLGPPHAVGSLPTTHVSERPPVVPALRWIGRRMWGEELPPPWASGAR